MSVLSTLNSMEFLQEELDIEDFVWSDDHLHIESDIEDSDVEDSDIEHSVWSGDQNSPLSNPKSTTSLLDTWRTLKLFEVLPDPEDTLRFHDSTFILFPDLPLELRRMVWKAAIDSIPVQTVALHTLEWPSHDTQSSDARDISQVNQESREVIQDSYIYVGSSNHRGMRARCFLNKSREIVEVSQYYLIEFGHMYHRRVCSCGTHICFLYGRETPYSISKIKQHLFDSIREITKIHFYGDDIQQFMDENGEILKDISSQEFPRCLSEFTSLEEVILSLDPYEFCEYENDDGENDLEICKK